MRFPRRPVVYDPPNHWPRPRTSSSYGVIGCRHFEGGIARAGARVAKTLVIPCQAQLLLAIERNRRSPDPSIFLRALATRTPLARFFYIPAIPKVSPTLRQQ